LPSKNESVGEIFRLQPRRVRFVPVYNESVGFISRF
jgi:hypothetical protein